MSTSSTGRSSATRRRTAEPSDGRRHPAGPVAFATRDRAGARERLGRQNRTAASRRTGPRDRAAAERMVAMRLVAPQSPVSALSPAWRRCVGTGRMSLSLRSGHARALAVAQREIGFDLVRGHGMFHDDMGVYRTDEVAGTRHVRHAFTYLDQVVDGYLELGLRPFLELGFMPSGLASGDQTVFWWNGNVTPPRSYPEWQQRVDATLRHLVGRYGAPEVPERRVDQLLPFGVGPRRGHVAVPPEHRLVARSEAGGHEAQLEERPQPELEVSVDHLVEIGERVPDVPGARDLGRAVHAHVVVEHAVAADEVAGTRHVRHAFTYLDQVVDGYLELGLRPFLELGFMPSGLASGDQTVFWWNGNVTPPRSYPEWQQLVDATLRHLVARYGAPEVRRTGRRGAG